MYTRLYPSRSSVPWKERLGDWSGSLILLPVCLWFATHRGTFTLLDNADLLIHEAGHFLLSVFGRHVMFAGGTLMQLVVPSLLVWHFTRTDYRFGVQVSLFWLGHNLINISVYAADARARALPLLGGDTVEHDWHTMLGWVDLLAWDAVIGWFFFALALVVFVRTLALPISMRSDPPWKLDPEWQSPF